MALYDAYIMLQNMSYEEFEKLVTTGYLKTIIEWLIIAVIFFILGKWSRYKINPESKRKLKQICRWEKRPVRYQVRHIIEMYIDAYSEKNGIDWEQRLY